MMLVAKLTFLGIVVLNIKTVFSVWADETISKTHIRTIVVVY